MPGVLAFAAPIVAALVLMWCARQALAPRWTLWARLVPRWMIHRWVLGTMAIAGLVLFFSVPFFLIGAWRVGLAGLVVAGLVTLVFGRDVLVWIFDDLRDHRREGRSLLDHSAGCVVHQHYHD